MATRPPNILFLFSDQHHADWIGAAEKVPVNTPHIDGIASRGVRFTGCRVASPMCAPSRACLATGLGYRRVGVPNNRYDLDPSLPTFMKALREVGYRVEVTGKSDLHKKSQQHGLDGWSQRLGELGFTDAFDHAGKRDSPISKGWPTPYEPYMRYMADIGLAETIYDDYQRRAAYESDGRGVPTWRCPYPREHHVDDFGARHAIERLRSLPTNQPWFLQVNLGSPHPPFDAPPELGERYAHTEFSPPARLPIGDDPTDHLAVRRQYAASIEGIDEWIGRILDVLGSRGESSNTLIVYTSDHGEMLGEYGKWNKGFPHEESVRVPLVVAGPGVASDATGSGPVDLIDLAATFCETAGAAAPPDWDAISLVATLEDPEFRTREYSTSAFGPWDLITDGEYRLTRYEVDHEVRTSLGTIDMDPEVDMSGDLRDIALRLTHELESRVPSAGQKGSK